MPAPRTAAQRAAYVRSTAADLDVAPDLAELLLMLSEAARAWDRWGRLDQAQRQQLRALLADDELCRQGWWVAAAEGEPLWRELAEVDRPGLDPGATLLLAVAVAARGASDDAFALIRRVLRVHGRRRSVLELGVDLAEDAGAAQLAWRWAQRLSGSAAVGSWPDLRLVVESGPATGPSAGGSAGVAHARWLRHRMHRWARRSWSPLSAGPPDTMAGATADPVAAAAVAYLRGRRSLLPPADRRLLGLWGRTARRHFTVVRVGRRGLVLDAGGRRRLAGWEGDAPPDLLPRAAVDGWLLPTLVPGQGLFVSSTRPPGFSSDRRPRPQHSAASGARAAPGADLLPRRPSVS